MANHTMPSWTTKQGCTGRLRIPDDLRPRDVRAFGLCLPALCAAQPISTPAFVTVGLRNPVADRLGSGFELTSRFLQCPFGAKQGDAQAIWRRKAGGYGGLDFGMVDTSSPKGQGSTKSGQLHREGRAAVFHGPRKLADCEPAGSLAGDACGAEHDFRARAGGTR